MLHSRTRDSADVSRGGCHSNRVSLCHAAASTSRLHETVRRRSVFVRLCLGVAELEVGRLTSARDHSVASALTGSILATRRAGSRLAARLTATSITHTPANTGTSRGSTRYSTGRSAPDARTASASPSTTPTDKLHDAPPHDERNQLHALGTERRAHAHLASPLRDGKRHDAVQARGGEQQRADPERHEERAERPCRTRSAARSPAASS